MLNVNIYKTTLETMEKYGYVVEEKLHQIKIRNPVKKTIIEILWVESEKNIIIMTKDKVVYAEKIKDIMFLKGKEESYVMLIFIEAEKFIEKTIQVSDVE